ncbi:hypothetical protein TNCV_4726441 [Trichonephila clavipes]|nr:hypothetical protein TNCV_4726441 [Trichonephila clavipes]
MCLNGIRGFQGEWLVWKTMKLFVVQVSDLKETLQPLTQHEQPLASWKWTTSYLSGRGSCKSGKSPKGTSKTSFLLWCCHSCYQQWQHRMQKCVNAEGNYSEVDIVTENSFCKNSDLLDRSHFLRVSHLLYVD